MKPSFLQLYLQAFSRIEGWFQFDAALLFMVYNRLLKDHVQLGDALEIGVFHGLSAIGTARLRGCGKRLVVVDPFEYSEGNVAMYGHGIRNLFEENFKSFYPQQDFLSVLARPSGMITAQDIGNGFSFCHIDGGHSRAETKYDLQLCVEASLDGGLIALDDYFNPQHPGVCEGAVEFFIENRSSIRPLVIAYNKVLFQKTSRETGINERFLDSFPKIDHATALMWDSPVLLLGGQPLRFHVDLLASTPEQFVPLQTSPPRADIRPSPPGVTTVRGGQALFRVMVENVSGEPLPCGVGVFGLSYHLLGDSGEVLVHDNERIWIEDALKPGDGRSFDLKVPAPERAGVYGLELDLVWEGVTWFKEIGNPAPVVRIEVA